MRNRAIGMFKNEAGVAMVTVLFIGAALTVLSSTAAFVTIDEFRAGSNDRKAVAALAYAEAGIDRFVSYLKSGLVTYKDLNTAGCSGPALALPIGQVESGTYEASLTVYDPSPPARADGIVHPEDRFPKAPNGGACATRPSSPHPGQGNDQTFFVITSIGRHPAATRTVRQVIALELIELPVGLYAHSVSVQSAKHPFSGVSLVSETEIDTRANISFIGEDPYYLVADFFPDAVGRAMNAPVPAGAHAAVQILLAKSRDPEFAADTKNCSANGTATDPSTGVAGNAAQSLWDSDGSSGSGPITSGCAGWMSGAEWPTSSRFTAGDLVELAEPNLSEQDHQTLRDAARRYGVYCSLPGVGGTGGSVCYKQDVEQTDGRSFSDYVNDVGVSATRNFVAYLDYRSGSPTQNNLGETFDVWGCSHDPDVSRSAVVIIRNGGVNWTGAGGTDLNGAMIVDGDFSATGSLRLNGTLIVRGKLNINSSAQHFSIDDCWVQNMPSPFFRVVPTQWSEIDR